MGNFSGYKLIQGMTCPGSTSLRPFMLTVAFVMFGLYFIGAADSASTLDFGGGRYAPRCEPIKISMCKSMRYNMTRMPNLAGQDDQAEAEARIKDFLPLVQTNCSRLLKFFLCSLYAPMCTHHSGDALIVSACRSMCLQVKAKCEPFLTSFNFEWPDMLACDKLPEKSDARGSLCMAPPNEDGDSDTTEGGAGARKGGADVDGLLSETSMDDISEKLNKLDADKNWDEILREKMNQKSRGRLVPTGTTDTTRYLPGRGHGLVLSGTKDLGASPDGKLPQPGSYPVLINYCKPRFVHVDELPRSNRTCAPRCDAEVLFRQEDKNFAGMWMLVWASICCFSTLLTVTTFAVDTSRFKYPERPIIFLSACYLVQSVAYILRAIVGSDAVSCDTGPQGQSFLIQEGLDSTWCIVIFLLLYFFGMASAVWWVVLTVTWFLAAGRKWGGEAIEALSSYFHLAAWAVPAIKTIIILTLRRVDGDELTGLCYVGGQNPEALTAFVLVPLIAYLVLGSAFILAGFLAMFRIRKDLKQEDGRGGNIRKLEKLMAKIGVFSVLYTVPATCVIGCLVYERVNFRRWRQEAWEIPCPLETSTSGFSQTGTNYNTKTQIASGIPNSASLPVIVSEPAAREVEGCPLDHSIPTVEVYMLKIFMSVVIGITSGMWVWSHKTLASWKTFCTRRFTRRKAASPGFGADYHPAPVVLMKNSGSAGGVAAAAGSGSGGGGGSSGQSHSRNNSHPEHHHNHNQQQQQQLLLQHQRQQQKHHRPHHHGNMSSSKIGSLSSGSTKVIASHVPEKRLNTILCCVYVSCYLRIELYRVGSIFGISPYWATWRRQVQLPVGNTCTTWLGDVPGQWVTRQMKRRQLEYQQCMHTEPLLRPSVRPERRWRVSNPRQKRPSQSLLHAIVWTGELGFCKRQAKHRILSACKMVQKKMAHPQAIGFSEESSIMYKIIIWSNGDAENSNGRCEFCNCPKSRGVGGTVASESALRSAGTLLSRVRAPPTASWPDGGPESLRSPCCGLAIYKKLKNSTPQVKSIVKLSLKKKGLGRGANEAWWRS
ncbi:frizzled-9-like [Plakobranchus ocellatus]|uniref:Frizzled-9-like n=1 Tax=Plakobranchus ocellatus TaxID=259542 RepID=A0AAV4A9Q4_9GAST|nr:frizzled-9-like [Plakobranchus ocellatus]